MRVGVLSAFPPLKCGIALYSDNLVKNMNKIKAVTIGSKGSGADYVVDFKSFSLKGRLERIIKKEMLDLLHIQYIAAFFSKYALNLNLLMALKQKIPVVVTLHEVHYTANNWRDRILSFLEGFIVRNASGVTVCSPYQKQFLEKKYGAKNIECIYHGISLFKEAKRNGRRLLFFGLITPNKGVHYLVEAMKYLPDCKLQIAGPVPKDIPAGYKDELLALIKKNKLKNVKIEFGWIDEARKNKYYENADAVIMPHIWAPYVSGSVSVAIAHGLPMVTTRVGSIWEYVSLFKTGEIIKPGSSKAIAEGVRKVFKDYNKYKGGIRKYRKAANWKNVGGKHIRLYKKVLKR